MKDEIDEWIYIDVTDQHPDSMRFIRDCERVIGKKITILKNPQYSSNAECFRAIGGFRILMGGGREFVPCTNWRKKRVRQQWELEHPQYRLRYVWGFDMDEMRRALKMEQTFPEYEHVFPLIERNLNKEDVHGYFERHFDFKRPVMYDLGYPNNNCIGCVHGGVTYWNKIRKDFSDVFEEYAKLERELEKSIIRGVYLDELDPARGNYQMEVFPECGIMCRLVEAEDDEND